MRRRAVALAVAIATLVGWQALSEDAEPATGAFDRPTGTVLVFDNGIDGVLAVDLDARVAARRTIHGQHGGDPPYRLGLVNDSFVVGWGQITAASIDGTRGRPIGEATIWIPAAEPRSVWLVDYPQDEVGGGRPSYRRVDLTGRTQALALAPADLTARAVAGVPTGILHETRTGIGVFDPNSGRWAYRSASGEPGTFLDRAGSLVAWCDRRCTRLHITDVSRPTEVTVKPPRGTKTVWRAAFSGDARLLAVAAGDLGPTSDDSRATIASVDVSTGGVSPIGRATMPAHPYLVWRGQYLFATSNSYATNRTHVAAFGIEDGWQQSITLPFGGALRPIALDRLTAAPILRAQVADMASCAGPGQGAKGDAQPCSFAF